jgi:uncharacterized protein YbjT (DUF2867 family)
VTIERLVAESSVPYTILRATQFHSFEVGTFAAQRFAPVVFAPSFTMQPIAVEEVAARLVELAGSDAAGRVADIGGPAQRTLPDLGGAWARASNTRRPIWPLRLPGKTFAGFASGIGMVPGTRSALRPSSSTLPRDTRRSRQRLPAPQRVRIRTGLPG